MLLDSWDPPTYSEMSYFPILQFIWIFSVKENWSITKVKMYQIQMQLPYLFLIFVIVLLMQWEKFGHCIWICVLTNYITAFHFNKFIPKKIIIHEMGIPELVPVNCFITINIHYRYIIVKNNDKSLSNNDL